MHNIIIINGPNLNMLGKREPEIYGSETIDDIKKECLKKGIDNNINIDFRQTNSEGEIINWLHEVNNNFDGLIINPAGYTHTSVAILDALKTIKKPKIEIHLSNIYAREEFRKKTITGEGMDGIISGFGISSYTLSIEAMKKLLG